VGILDSKIHSPKGSEAGSKGVAVKVDRGSVEAGVSLGGVVGKLFSRVDVGVSTGAADVGAFGVGVADWQAASNKLEIRNMGNGRRAKAGFIAKYTPGYMGVERGFAAV